MSKTQYNPSMPLDQRLKSAGGSKTVYALVMPEAERVLLETLAPAFGTGAVAVTSADFAPWLSDYHEAWTGKQDRVHADFFRSWQTWTAPVLTLGEGFNFRYPTAGASEGLFHLITSYGNRARQEGFVPAIHIFEGEYEGYPAYAESQSIDVRKHARTRWQEAVDKIGPKDQIYISQPSAIDGRLWPACDDFLAALASRQPTAQVILDLTYVGGLARAYHIRADHPNIEAVVFSLSKPMGVYYHRIGGLLSRRAMPSLFGNQWFKNLLALRYGTALMQKFGVQDLPRAYAPLQAQAAADVGRSLGFAIRPADVAILGLLEPEALREADPALASYLIRAPSDPDMPGRLCLSPRMAQLIAASQPENRLQSRLFAAITEGTPQP